MKTDLRDEQVWLAVGSLMILACVALAMSLSYARGVLIPFVLAVFVTITVAPLMDFQERRLRFPHPLAVATTLLAVLAALAIFGLLVSAAALPASPADASQPVADLPGGDGLQPPDPGEALGQSFADMAGRMFEKLEQWKVVDKREEIIQKLQAKLPSLATQTVGTATGLLSNSFLVVIFVIFLLAGRRLGGVRTGIYPEVEASVRQYIATKLALSAATGILVWIVLALFGLKMAALFGLLAFMLNFIPSIGSIIATLLPLPVAIMQFGHSPWTVVAVVGIPGMVQMVVGNVIEPKLLGKGLELHPVTVLLALTFWGLLWGIVGMVLAVPITATIRIVLMRFATTKPIGDLLAGQLPGTSAPSS